MPALEMTNPAALPADWRDFLALTKPRVMSLVVFTGLCGLLAAPELPPLVLGFTAILCIALGAGACGALNQWYEADLDAQDAAHRQAPASRRAGWTAQAALHFGVGLGAFSVLLMGLATNWLAAVLLAASILFYVLVYTVWLKPRTAQNIVIGGAAGAFPPLIGWVAATGHFAALPLLLFAIIFLWTPPHFWALSLFVRSDYAAAGIPMLPVVAGVEQHAPADFPLQPADGRRGGRAMAARPDRPDLWRARGDPQRRYSVMLAARVLANRATEPARMAPRSICSAIRCFYLFALFTRRSSPTAGCRGEARGRTDPQRQRDRARIMALLLGAFVVLLFFITIAKTGMNW